MIIQPCGAHDADNLYDIPEMIALARRHGVRMLRVIPAVPCGQAKENHVLMTPFEYAEVARMVAEGRSSAPDLIIDCPIDQRIEKDRSLYCRAGTLWLYFDFKGNVYPCNNIQEPEARCWPNSIKTDRADLIWRTSPLLNYMRDYKRSGLAAECRECALRVSCAGECRAMTWARYKRFDLAVKPDNCYRDQYPSNEGATAPRMDLLAASDQSITL
jgi:radical SAM protein with 4Fe4S-binding SPASM domain